MRLLLASLIFCAGLNGGEYAVVTSAKSQIETLGKKSIRDLFLKKRTFYESTELFAINLTPSNNAREEFERKVLEMARDDLNEYWIINHYKGIKPPIVQRSEAGVKEFVKNRPNFIGYLPKSLLDGDMKVLYEF